jgi:hypothetical protein
MHTDIHALSGIRTHDPSVQASEDISCLRPRGHCGRLMAISASKKLVSGTNEYYMYFSLSNIVDPMYIQ